MKRCISLCLPGAEEGQSFILGSAFTSWRPHSPPSLLSWWVFFVGSLLGAGDGRGCAPPGGDIPALPPRCSRSSGGASLPRGGGQAAPGDLTAFI